VLSPSYLLYCSDIIQCEQSFHYIRSVLKIHTVHLIKDWNYINQPLYLELDDGDYPSPMRTIYDSVRGGVVVHSLWYLTAHKPQFPWCGFLNENKGFVLERGWICGSWECDNMYQRLTEITLAYHQITSHLERPTPEIGLPLVLTCMPHNFIAKNYKHLSTTGIPISAMLQCEHLRTDESVRSSGKKSRIPFN